MIRSSDYLRGPLVERTNSNDNTLNALAQEFSNPTKVERASPRVQRNSLSPKKRQQSNCIQHFVPCNDKPLPIKIKLAPKMEQAPSVRKICASPARSSPRPRFPTQSSFRRTPVDGMSKTVNIKIESNEVFPIQALPQPPLCADAACPPPFFRDSVRSDDVEWMNNPVFQKRSSRAAIMIQAQARRMLAVQAFADFQQRVAATKVQRTVRGFVQRSKWSREYRLLKAVRTAQKMVRGFLVRHKRETNQAATQIQRVVRGFVGRLRGKVARLENLLTTVQAEHADELYQIQKHKERHTKGLRDAARKSEKKKEKKARLAMEAIEELRKSNRNLREKNHDLEKRCEQLHEQNKRLEGVIKKCYGHIDELKATIKRLEADQKKLVFVLNSFEQKRDKLLEAIRKADEMTQFEQKIGAIYMKTIKEHITKINTVCPDKDLANEVYSDTRSMLEEVQEKIAAVA